MGPWIVAYISTGVAFAGLDAAWLSFATGRIYRPQIGGLMLDSFRQPPAVLFYLIYIGGIVFLAIGPALRWPAGAGPRHYCAAPYSGSSPTQQPTI